MATLAIQPPAFRNTGANKEPVRISQPVGTGAVFEEHDFVVVNPVSGAPQTNGTVLNPPANISAAGSTSAGSITSGTYFVTTTLLNANGETTIGPVVPIVLGATGQIIVQSPPPQGDAVNWRLYIGTVLGAYHLQGSTTAIGTAITQTTYSAAGAAPPSTNATGLAAPSAPSLAAGGSGGPAARTEYYTVTYVNDIGETVASSEASQALTAGQVVTVTSPGASGNATGYNVYASTVSGQEVKQNSTPIAIGTNWTEPTTGLLLAGVQRAITNQSGIVNGVGVIVGVADHDYNAVYGGPVGGVQPGLLSGPTGRPNFNQSVFGITERNLGTSQEPLNAHAVSAKYNQFEISLLQAWDPGYVGQFVGLLIDSASNFFVADMTQSNKVAQIVGTVDGPGRGVAGDVYKRVAIKVLDTAAFTQ
jgi:hypothetical protein